MQVSWRDKTLIEQEGQMVKIGGLDASGKAVGIQEDSIGFREAD